MHDLHNPLARVRIAVPNGTVSSALYGGDHQQYRYLLERSWGGVPRTYPCAIWILHNPSVDTEDADDAALWKCRAITENLGFFRMVVLNVLAYRTALKADLHKTTDPLGPDNLRRIQETLQTESGIVIGGWGHVRQKFGPHLKEVKKILRRSGRLINAVDLTLLKEPARPCSSSVTVKATLIPWMAGTEPYVSSNH